jgi:hypothetical protein
MTKQVEREMLTMMFEGDLDLAKSFNQVGALHEARLHLNGASEKLSQIESLEAPAPKPPTKIIEA